MISKNQRRSERGQALIVIALAVLGLLGLTALAVDGSHVYAQLRQAQNAADTAAFAAALARIKALDPDLPTPNTSTFVLSTLQRAGLDRAAQNKFADTLDEASPNPGEPIDVIVNNPPLDSAPIAYQCITNPVIPSDPCNNYVQVIIKAQIPTFFARIVGFETLPIHVQAIALALPKRYEKIGGDNGIVALGQGCDLVKFNGSFDVHLTGGGIWSNSTSNGPGTCFAVDAPGSGQVYAEGLDVNAVGCAYNTNNIHVDPGGHIYCLEDPIPIPPEPDIDFSALCQSPGTISGTTASPGIYDPSLGNLNANGSFPKKTVDHLDPGVYCIHGDFKIGGSPQATNTLISNGGVTFIIYDGDTTWNGGATINIQATGDGDLKGLLLYVVPGSCGTPPCRNVYLEGSGTSTWTGTIFGTDAYCRLIGTQEGVSISSQAICYKVEVGGSADWNLNYDGAGSWRYPIPPATELTR